MKYLLILVCVTYIYIVNGATVRPRYNNEGDWNVLRYEKDEVADGYHYLYETENKILAEEDGKFRSPGEKDEKLQAIGYYEYVGDDGKTYRVDYTSDENGFVPVGDHIPKTPKSVLRTLQWLKDQGKL